MASIMKTKVKSLFLAIFSILVLSQPAKSQNYKENSLLWEISGKDLENPSYLFAILKFIPEEDYIFHENAENAFNACGILATETHLDHHAKHELNKAAHLPHGESLESYLGDEYYKKLEAMFTEQLGISHMKFNLVYKKFKPVMLSTTITRLSLNHPMKYYEPTLMIKAHEKNMITMGLETVEREVEALESFAMEDQVVALKHTIDNLKHQQDDYNAVVKAYQNADLHKVLEYTLHPVENNESFRKTFIIDRNKEWIPKMVEYMHMAPTFFAIGASHVADEAGVLHLLEEEGYTVKPIKD